MRHQKRVKTLNRTKSHRKALLMNLANSLFHHESIKTTNPKAMELKRVAERLITLAKRKDLHSLRLAFSFLRDKNVVRKLFSDIGERYSAINGGYTRVLKIGNRKGDNAPMALIELTQKKEEKKAKEEKKPAKKADKKSEKKTEKKTTKAVEKKTTKTAEKKTVKKATKAKEVTKEAEE
ncbi:MAG: ribosomal protein [Deltaproteobacteria bacterium]|jgi:large subunit ribosomal protein L17|nr:ribosomal protein [Deltaproteobacteria bacterium]